jgi:putative ATPase
VLRDRVLDAAALQRHSLVLDLNAATGLLTWEALRRAPEGGVWALTADPQTGAALQQQAERLPEVERPTVLIGEVVQLPDLLRARGAPDVRFDAAVGRNVLTRCVDKTAALGAICACLRDGGRLSLAEVMPRRGQRLSALVDLTELGAELAARLQAAEEAIYHAADDPQVNWDSTDLEATLHAAGFELRAPLNVDVQEDERHLTAAHLTRWFSRSAEGPRPSYASHLLSHLTAEELRHVEGCFRRQLLDQIVSWHITIVYVIASAAPEKALA